MHLADMYEHGMHARGLFHHDSSKSSNHTCPSEDHTPPTIVHLVGNLDYHQFSTALSAACALFSALIAFFIIALHATHYSNPVQQRQVIRIVLLVPWVSLFAFLTVWREDAGEYLAVSLDFGCSIALGGFLLFMCDLVLSDRGGFEVLFGRQAWSNGARVHSPAALRFIWYGVLQFIPSSIFIWVASAATLALGWYCKQSNSPHFAHIWIAVINFVVTSVSITCCLWFYHKNKARLQQHRIMLKLWTFKGIIGLNVAQTFVISILSGQKVLHPTKYMTYHDINYGLPSLVLACEMPIFSILLLLAFPVKPYKGNGRAAGPLTAIVAAFNITDLLSCFVRGPMRLLRDQQSQILLQNMGKEGDAGSPLVMEHREMGTTEYRGSSAM